MLFLIGTLLLSNTASASSLALDAFIVCDDPLPYGFPVAGYSADEYKHTMDLCSAVNGATKNLGCLCTSSNANLQCHEVIADPTLWAAQDPFYPQETLTDFCWHACSCSTSADARTERMRTLNAQAQQQKNGPPSSNGLDATVNTPAISDPSSDATSHPPASQNQCGTQCTTNDDCKVKGADAGCLCSTQSEQYAPGTGTVAFLAACIVSLGGKRDEGRPCPCNGTYVSHSCCEAEHGLVWEAEEFKLGELMERDTPEVPIRTMNAREMTIAEYASSGSKDQVQPEPGGPVHPAGGIAAPEPVQESVYKVAKECLIKGC